MFNMQNIRCSKPVLSQSLSDFNDIYIFPLLLKLLGPMSALKIYRGEGVMDGKWVSSSKLAVFRVKHTHNRWLLYESRMLLDNDGYWFINTIKRREKHQKTTTTKCQGLKCHNSSKSDPLFLHIAILLICKVRRLLSPNSSEGSQITWGDSREATLTSTPWLSLS